MVVEDHEVVRAGLCALIEAEPGLAVVGTAGRAEEGLALVASIRPDVILLDLTLPGMSGMAAIGAFLRSVPSAGILVLSGHQDDQHVSGALTAGARGYVVKADSLSELIHAIRCVGGGGTYLSSPLTQWFAAKLRAGKNPSQPRINQLGMRERQVLQLVARGMTSKEVASELSLQTETIRTYRKTLMRKLGVTNLAALTRVAVEEGLVESGEAERLA